jgi:hypothetical protein
MGISFFSRDLIAKQLALSLQPPGRNGRRTRACRSSWPSLSSGHQVAKGSTEARNGVRRTKGPQWWAHQRWRTTEKPGIGRRRRFGHGGRLQRYRQRKKAKGIRWERPRNCRLNDKTERNRRDERDGVLTFGQR